MAETKRRGRPPKSETTPKKVEEKKTDDSQEELIKKLVARESLFEGLAIFVAIVAAIGWWFLFR